MRLALIHLYYNNTGTPIQMIKWLTWGLWYRICWRYCGVVSYRIFSLNWFWASLSEPFSNLFPKGYRVYLWTLWKIGLNFVVKNWIYISSSHKSNFSDNISKQLVLFQDLHHMGGRGNMCPIIMFRIKSALFKPRFILVHFLWFFIAISEGSSHFWKFCFSLKVSCMHIVYGLRFQNAFLRILGQTFPKTNRMFAFYSFLI